MANGSSQFSTRTNDHIFIIPYLFCDRSHQFGYRTSDVFLDAVKRKKKPFGRGRGRTVRRRVRIRANKKRVFSPPLYPFNNHVRNYCYY